MSTTTTIAGAVPAIVGGRNAAASAALRSMSELGVAGLIGAGCVQNQSLTPSTIKALSSTTFSILLPLFLCTSIVTSASKYGLDLRQASVPLLAIAQCLLLYAITTQITLPIFGIDAHSEDGRGAAVCCSFGNSGVLPLIFCESLFRGRPDGAARSAANVSLYLAGWSPFFWAFGRGVLLGTDDDGGGGGGGGIDGGVDFLDKLKRALPPPVMGVLAGLFVASTPLRRLFVAPPPSSSAAAAAADLLQEGTEASPPPVLSAVFNSAANLGRAASPLSLLILVSSLAVGAGIGEGGGGGAGGAGGGGGKGGATAARSAAERNTNVSEARGTEEGGAGGGTSSSLLLLKKWSLVLLTRFLLSPSLMYGLLVVSSRIGLVRRSEDDPFLWFALLLEASMPPAQNQVVMLQVADRAEAAGEMAKFLFLTYASSMVPVVLILTWTLQRLGLA